MIPAFARRDALVVLALAGAVAAASALPVLRTTAGQAPLALGSAAPSEVPRRGPSVGRPEPAPAKRPGPPRPERPDPGPMRPSKPVLDGPLDLNRTDAATLQALPGIGPTLAARIISHRTERGPFRAVADLREVPGIGPKRFERLQALVRVAP